MRTAALPRVRVVAVALAFLVAVVAALGAWQVVAARSSQQAEVEAGEMNAAHLASSALGSALASRLELLTNLAGQPGVATIFAQGRADQAKVTAALHELYPGFASFDLVSPTGQLEARWPADPSALGHDLHSSFFERVLHSGRPGVSQAVQQKAAPHELVALLASPVRGKSGALAGVLAASLPGAGLSALIGGPDLASKGSVLIFDHEGAAFNGHGPHGPARAVPAISRALAGRTGSAVGRVPGLVGERLIGYAPVPSTGWVVLVEQPASMLNGTIEALTVRLAFIGAAVLVLAVGSAALMASLLKRLTRERLRAGSLLASLGEGVMALSPDGTVQLANPAMEQLTGRRRDELVGRSWAEAVHAYDRRGEPISWQASMAARAAREGTVLASTGYDLHVARADGQRVPVSVTAAPLVAGDELLGSVVALRDVTAEREVDQLKSTLVSTVSHELRTPLTMVQGFSELLLSRQDLGPQRSQEALEQIHGAAQRLGRLIDDLLSVSRIDSGKLRVDLGAVPLRPLVDEVVRACTDSTQGDGTGAGGDRLVVEVDPLLAPVMADRDKLVQILTNLVSNALKYSAPRTPVTVRAERKLNHAEVSVADEGIGMSEAECSQVFEKFSRADRPEVRRVSGTGLGLYITKSLVELQHGQIWVHSELGRGSTFTFALPLAPDRERTEVLSLQDSRETA